MPSDATAPGNFAANDRTDARSLHAVPNPLPLTLAGMLAALGPQAINFGISIGGGEAYLLPNISARGTLHMHWLMLLSVVLETALVYECIKYSVCTGRSFSAATNELKPYGFWPWFWAGAILTSPGPPGWAARSSPPSGSPASPTRQSGAFRRITSGRCSRSPGAGRVLLLRQDLRVPLEVLFSDHGANIALVLLITGIAAKPEHYWQVLLGYLGHRFCGTDTRTPCQRPMRSRSSTSPAAA